jgi:Protein of unknown function (DUF1073)
MADIITEQAGTNLGVTSLGSPLMKILMSDNIELGSSASYELCKLIYSYHPLGGKLIDAPVQLAQSQGRMVNIPGPAEERVKKAYQDEWARLNCDVVIANCARLARIYGVSSIACMVKDDDHTKPLDFATLSNKKIAFNVFDPLNTAGSLIMNQDPNSISFLKPISIMVQGQPYHPTRTVVHLNEDPIYLDYTTSAYGYVGRSVYQRALFPLKSFLQTMLTDDLVTKKAGVVVAKLKPPGSIINNVMQSIAGIKRQMLKDALVGSVLNISIEESIESLNLQNIDTSARSARKNILENIAAAAGMPAKLVNSETLAVAFAEGEEDAKAIARFIDKLRESMQHLYDYFNQIVQFRAWNYDFYKTIQTDYKDYKGKSYNEAFTEWTNHFFATWPSLLTEPDSEKIKVANVKLRSIIALLDTLLPMADPASKEMLIESAVDNFNDMKILFPTPFKIDAKKMAAYSEQQAQEEKEMGMQKAQGANPMGEKKGKGFGGKAFGSGSGTGVSAKADSVDDAVIDLLDEVEHRRKRMNDQILLSRQ